MIFIISKKLGDYSKDLVIGGSIKHDDSKKLYTVEDILYSGDVFQAFAGIADFKLAVVPEFKNPLLLCTTNSGVTRATQIYEFIDNWLKTNHTNNLPEQISQALIQKMHGAGLSDDDAGSIIVLSMNYRNYLMTDDKKTALSFGVDMYDSDFYESTKSYVDSVNQSSVWPFSKLQPGDNKTVFMNTPEDRLFIHIPHRQLLLDDEVNVKSLLPKKSEFFNPYGTMRLDDMTTYKEPGVKFPAELLPAVEGMVINNELPVQDNEQDYLDALTEWVQFNMREDAGSDIDVSTSNPNIDNASQYYLSSLCELLYSWNWDHNINIPEYSELPDDLENESDSDSVKSNYVYKATKSEKEAIAAGYTDLTGMASVHVNALECMLDFLREASLHIGYRAYLEAVIQLARWGSRKPTALYFKGYPLIFDLGSNKARQYIGSIDNYELNLSDGRESTAICAIYNKNPFMDRKYLKSFGYEEDILYAPIGVISRKVFSNKTSNGPKELKFEIYSSLIDVVRSYVTGTGEFLIQGIDYVDGSFVCDDVLLDTSIAQDKLLQAYQKEKSSMMINPFVSSESLQNLYLDLGVTASNSDVPNHHFSILQSKQRVSDLRSEFTSQHFDSKEDLDEKRSRREIRLLKYAVETGIASVILPIYVEVSKRLRDQGAITFSDVLNVYRDVMIERNYVDEADFMKNYKRKVAVKGMNTDSSLNKMSLFGGGTVSQTDESVKESKVIDEYSVNSVEKQEKPVEPVRIQENVAAASKLSFIKEVNSRDKYFSLVDKYGGVVGGCAVRKMSLTKGQRTTSFNIYVFVDDTTIGSIPADRIIKKQEFKRVIPLMTNDLYLYERGSYETITAFFSSLETMDYYRHKIKSLLENDQL